MTIVFSSRSHHLRGHFRALKVMKPKFLLRSLLNVSMEMTPSFKKSEFLGKDLSLGTQLCFIPWCGYTHMIPPIL